MNRIASAGKALVIAALLSTAGCSDKGQAGPEEGVEVLAQASTAATFDPTGRYLVHTDGMSLLLRRVGDPRVFHLTKSPPAETSDEEDAGKSGSKESGSAAADERKCVPAAPSDPVVGPQEGWPGHPAWSPDGRFIAFVAPWKDGNCDDSDDGDFDVWIVDVTGLDLDRWVLEVPGEAGEGKKESTWYVVGPDGEGLRFYQATGSAGAEWDPAWSTCRSLAWRSDAGILRKDLGFIPGICASPDEEKRLLEEKLAECQRKLEKTQDELEDLQQIHATCPAPATVPVAAGTAPSP